MPEVPEIPGKPILDYASPAARSRLRLTDKSIITLIQHDGGTDVVESLTGQVGAVAAIVFTGFTVTLLGCNLLDGPPNYTANIHSGPFILYLLFVLAVLALMLAVVHANWRQAILRVTHDQLTLTFKSPLKREIHQWPSDEIRFVQVAQTIDSTTRQPLYELRIELSFHGALRLFGGHDPPRLTDIAEIVRRHLPTEPPIISAAAATTGSSPSKYSAGP